MLLSARTDAAASGWSRAAARLQAIPLETWVLGTVVAIGALLRFTTLGSQSYWSDEASTVHQASLSFSAMFSSAVSHEANPPTYFVLTWVWLRLFGSDEFGFRSLSALAGTAVIPIAYFSGRELVSKNAGMVAALLAAVSPFMIWYSQDATEYMLLAATSGASLLCFARAIRQPTARNMTWWGVASALAILTHFFAVFLVAPEALWLLYAVRRRAAVIATAGVAAVGMALTPLLFMHANNSILGFISITPLRIRIEQLPIEFGLGTLYKSSLISYGLLGAAVATGILITLLVIGASSQQLRGAGLAAALAGFVLLAPLLLALLGKDYYIPRALIPAWIPLAIVVGAACTARRTLIPGAAFGLALVAMFVYAQVRVERNPQYQRPDWRGVAQALGTTPSSRVIVAYNGQLAVDPLSYYLPRTRWDISPDKMVSVGEVDVVASIWQPPAGRLPPGAKLLAHTSVASSFVVDRFSVKPAWRLSLAGIAARAGELASPAPPERYTVFQAPAKP